MTNFRNLLVLALALLTGACATSVNLKSALQAYHDGKPCCQTFAELQYEQLTFPGEVSFKIDETSQMFDFGSLGKSYVRAFELPATTATYRLEVRSYIIFDGIQIGPNAAMFFPLITLLDADRKPLGTSRSSVARFIPSTLWDEPNNPPKLEIALLVKPESGVRYVVVHTSRELIEFGGVAANHGVRIAAGSAPIFIPMPSGPSGPSHVSGSPYGDLKIVLEPPRT